MKSGRTQKENWVPTEFSEGAPVKQEKHRQVVKQELSDTNLTTKKNENLILWGKSLLL